MPDKPSERELTPEEIAANVAKAHAEAEKFKADAEKLAAERDIAKAQARSEAARAAEAELELETTRHEAEDETRAYLKSRSSDEFHHVYYFKGAVNESSTQACIDQLNFWRRTEEPGEIEIVFFSPGGSVFSGMVLFDHIVAMRGENWHFTTTTRGYAASMGGILLQAGDVRVCGPESYILIHEISSGAVGKIGELEDEVEFIKLIQKRVNDIFVHRSGGKVTSAKLRAMYRRKDFWVDSAKALELGIVDKIG